MRIVVKDGSAVDEILRGAIGQATRRRMGEYLLSQAERAFAEQRRGGVPWPPRGVPNVAGALMDLEKGPSIKSRRFDPRPAGVDEGRLRRMSLGENFAFTARGFEVFSTVPYADRFQEGGRSRIPITANMLKNLAIVMGKARRSVDATRKRGVPEAGTPAGARFERAKSTAGLGWLFGVAKRDGEVEVTTPPRPFLTIEKGDEAALTRIAWQGAAKAAG